MFRDKNTREYEGKNMNLYHRLTNRKENISIIGLGYVGLPIAIAFDRLCNVIGFDINEQKINTYKMGHDPTKEVGDDAVKDSNIYFTTNPNDLKKAKFHIVAVPTPINENHTPNLSHLMTASKTLGQNLTYGSIVVYESTVFPGTTEDICFPILEKESGLICGIDFKVGYSPERINPGDKVHRLDTITKIVSAMDEESLDIIAKVYELVVDVGVYRATSIKVAEAAKVIENSQRDINIAFMNELAIIFNRLGIDTKSVLEAAGTKWNFLKFYPGLVGGHCIGVDPYYLTFKAEQAGYHSQIILAGRRINDSMGKFVVENLIKLLILSERQVKNARIAILGFTFKENCPDIRNTKVVDIVRELAEYGIKPIVTDPQADTDEVMHEYGIQLTSFQDIHSVDAIVLAVAHDEYKSLTITQIDNLFDTHIKIMMDLKGIFDHTEYQQSDYLYWRL